MARATRRQHLLQQAGLVAVLAGCATPADTKPMTLRLGTATPGGGFPVYGDAFARSLATSDATLSLVPTNTKGSADNVDLLLKGDLELALVSGEVASDVLLGLTGPARPLKIVWAMYPQQAMFAVPRNSPIQDVRQLVGKRVVWGARTSGLVVLARYVMDGMGLDMQRDFDSVMVDRAADGPAMVVSGDAAAIFGAGIGSPALDAVAAAPGGARLVVPGPEEFDRIQRKHSFLKRMTVPAGSFAGQAAPVETVGSWAFVMARADLPEATGWRVASAAHRAREALAKLPQATTSTLRNTVDAAPSPQHLHAGVARFARENGAA